MIMEPSLTTPEAITLIVGAVLAWGSLFLPAPKVKEPKAPKSWSHRSFWS